MALEKQSLNNFLPNGFETEDKEGYKTNFSDDKISTGFLKDVADILSGPNLNNLIDVVGKNTNTLNKYVNYLNEMPINSIPITDSNNKLNYTNIKTINNNSILGEGNIDIDVTSGIQNIWATTQPTTTSYSSKSHPSVVIKEYLSGTSGYRIWSTGYCEQWGRLSTGGSTTVSFLKKFKDTNYIILGTTINTSFNTGVATSSRTTSSAVIGTYMSAILADWKACGYLASGQY